MDKSNAGKVNPILPKADQKSNQKTTFDAVKRSFETAYKSGGDYTPELYTLSRAVAHSVLKKCLDPQKGTAWQSDKVSDNGQSPALLDLKRGIEKDLTALKNLDYCTGQATKATYNEDGDRVEKIADRDANNGLSSLIDSALTDGIDLVHAAAVALLEQAKDHAGEGGAWLDEKYTVRRLSKRVYIRLEDSAAYRENETTPIQEVYRAVRRAVMESRAVQTDPKSGYTYISDLTPDGLDAIYYRMRRYADIGGYTGGRGGSHTPGGPVEYGGGGTQYTADRQTVTDLETLILSLGLTDRQAVILQLRMQGKGHKAIATYLGVTQRAVAKTVEQMRKKAVAAGLTPDGYNG